MNTVSDFRTVKGYQMSNSSGITSATEDYLEMIFRNSKINGVTRINFLAARLSVSPSSASRMVQHLKELGLVEFEKYGMISLTPKGSEMGQYLLHRHEVIHTFLCRLNGTENELRQTELIEHTVDKKTVDRLELLTEFMAAEGWAERDIPDAPADGKNPTLSEDCREKDSNHT